MNRRRSYWYWLLRIMLLGIGLTACGTDRWSQAAQPPAVSVTTSKPSDSMAEYQGALDVADCGTISGWALDKNRPDSPISVDILDGDALLATVPASGLRPDLRAAGLGSGTGGFSYTVPPGLRRPAPSDLDPDSRDSTSAW